MRVIGIDPGTAITGWGIVEGDGNDLKMIACGAITTAAGMPLPQRLQIIYRELSKIVEQWQPQASAIEELFFSKNIKSYYFFSRSFRIRYWDNGSKQGD